MCSVDANDTIISRSHGFKSRRHVDIFEAKNLQRNLRKLAKFSFFKADVDRIILQICEDVKNSFACVASQEIKERNYQIEQLANSLVIDILTELLDKGWTITKK